MASSWRVGTRLGPVADAMHVEVTEAAEGASVGRLRVAPDVLNPNGVLHGGAVYILVDYGMGAATMSLLDAGETCATVEIKISYFAAVREGGVRCETRVLKRGRQIVFLESRVLDDTETLVAAASGSYCVLSPRPAERRSAAP